MPFENLADADHVSLATRRRDGSWARTPVWFAIVDGRLYARTIADSAKVKRLRNDAAVELAPCTAQGEIQGPSVTGSAVLLADDAPAVFAANRALDDRYGERRHEMTRLMAEQGKALIYIEVAPARSDEE